MANGQLTAQAWQEKTHRMPVSSEYFSLKAEIGKPVSWRKTVCYWQLVNAWYSKTANCLQNSA
jgi:hypothetical protein